MNTPQTQYPKHSGAKGRIPPRAFRKDLEKGVTSALRFTRGGMWMRGEREGGLPEVQPTHRWKSMAYM